MKKFEKISYRKLTARQQENYNFSKISALLADYGFNTLRLTDDWKGADFIANHVDGETFLKVQLKGRFTLDKKYVGKNIWVCFKYRGDWYLYPHDEVISALAAYSNFQNTESWTTHGKIHNGNPSRRDLELLKSYKL